MTSHPILFSAPMVRALLERRKTVTRRLSKQWLKFKAGDELWVRETWCPVDNSQLVLGGDKYIEYRATPSPGFVSSHPAGWEHAPDDAAALKWKPSIHMPRSASRITLSATEDARLEYLSHLTEEEAFWEGICGDPRCNLRSASFHIDMYRKLWNEMHGKTHPWESNPEVVRIAFEVVKP